MIKSALSIIITIALGASSIFYFYEYNFFVGVLLLVWFLSRLFGYNLKRLAKGFGEITTYSNLETRCNCQLEFNINLENVLKHPSIDRLFIQLQKNNSIASSIQKEDWIKTMLDNYRKCGSDGWENVRFNIKNNMLWKNGDIDFYDSIYHKIFIPYKYIDGKEENSNFLNPLIEVGLQIRLLIVNGMVKLQVGDFSKDYSPKLLDSWTYQNHDTITTFPLMYFSYLHKIPENYLNLSAYATESWKNLHVEKDKKSKDFTSDWKKLNKEIKDYNYLCSVADEYVANRKRWDAIVTSFEKKKKAWLEKEKFRNPFAGDDYEDDDRLPVSKMWFVNNYLNVNVFNYNDSHFKYGREKYVYTDYYQER